MSQAAHLGVNKSSGIVKKSKAVAGRASAAAQEAAGAAQEAAAKAATAAKGAASNAVTQIASSPMNPKARIGITELSRGQLRSMHRKLLLA